MAFISFGQKNGIRTFILKKFAVNVKILWLIKIFLAIQNGFVVTIEKDQTFCVILRLTTGL